MRPQANRCVDPFSIQTPEGLRKARRMETATGRLTLGIACDVPGCGKIPFVQQREGFVLNEEMLNPEQIVILYERTIFVPSLQRTPFLS